MYMHDNVHVIDIDICMCRRNHTCIDWCLISLSLSLSLYLSLSPANEFGLFKPDEDPTKGRWLEQGRTLEYYDLKSGDMLQYRKKLRPLRVRTLDGSVKTLLVDDSQTVAELIKAVCARIGKTCSISLCLIQLFSIMRTCTVVL